MFKSYKLDTLIRNIISVLYRITLMSYGLVILLTSNNYFSWFYYLLTFVVYFSLFLILYKKNKWFSKLRLLNDYCFIVLLLYNKDINLINYPFLLLPIFNSPNHTGYRRGILTYLFTIIAFFILLKGAFNFYCFIPLLFILVIDLFEQLRTRVLKFSSSLYDAIDNFYLTKINIRKSHLIYNEIINRLNSSKFRFFFTTISISSFKLKNDKFSLLNSSEFIWDYHVKESLGSIKSLKEGQLVKNSEIQLNSKGYSENIYIPVKVESDIYVYVFIIKNLQVWNFCRYYIYWYLIPILSKITVVLKIEKELRDDREEYIKKMKSKLYYVNNATLAMHFLRNKFTPIKNYFEMVDGLPTLDQSKKEQYESILQKELGRAKNSMKGILDRTNLILEKSENPFIVTQLTQLSLKKVLDICRKIWYDFFDNDTISFEWKSFETFSKTYGLNEDGMEIVVTDIVENLQEYNNGYYRLRFVEDILSFNVIFENDLKNYELKKAEFEKLIKDFMLDDNIEINKRTTHGMSMIKSFLNQMKIVHNLYIENKVFYFKLTFNK